MALRHLYENVMAAAKQNEVEKAFVWEIESNARINHSMRPRFRAEGVVLAALSATGITPFPVGWSTISSKTQAGRAKADYSDACEVCGMSTAGADPQAVLVALAALKG